MSNSIITNNGLNSLINPDKKTNSEAGGLAGLLKAKQQADQANLNIHKQAPTDDFRPSAKGLQAALGVSAEQSYAYSHTMSLQLTTREGDQVTVDFRQLYAEYQSFKQTQYAEEGPKGARYFESREAMEATAFEERFGFSVQGDLNEDELGAVFKVFEQVDQLSNEFFNGDIEKAFEQAQNLNVDFGQLQSISLGMNKTEVKTSAYQQVAAYQGSASEAKTTEDADTSASIADLPPYLQKWQQAVDNLDQFFEDARGAFDDVLSSVLAQKFPEQGDRPSWFERVSGFHDQLADMAKLDKVTLKPSGVEIETPETLAAHAKEESEKAQLAE